MGENEKHGMIVTIEECIDRFAGETIRKKIMVGSEEITEKTDEKKIAEWIKGAMDRLDALVDEETRFRIMEYCGYKCSEINRNAIEEAITRREKFKDIDDFLETEQRNPMRGTRLIREEDVLHQFYTPQDFGVRCYCSMVRAATERISSTYCHCAKGFVKKLWEGVLERPVEVELVKSVISGADECEFKIYL